MGLDQSWSTVERTQFADHRKFNALEGFMRLSRGLRMITLTLLRGSSLEQQRRMTGI